MIGYFRKDANGKIEKCSKCKDGRVRTSSSERFNKFFSYLGQGYKDLLKNHPKIYDEIRCGLTHEFLPKKYKFSVTKKSIVFIKVSDKDGCGYIIKGETSSPVAVTLSGNSIYTPIGIDFLKLLRYPDGLWLIVVPKLLEDFKIGIEKFKKEIEDGKNQDNFFETANEINMEKFDLQTRTLQ